MSVEERVDELEARVEALEAENRMLTPSGRDRYDADVVNRLQGHGESVETRKVLQWYRDAGVKNRKKIKNRIKDLEAAGLIECVGKTHWRYVGPEQDTLEVSP